MTAIKSNDTFVAAIIKIKLDIGKHSFGNGNVNEWNEVSEETTESTVHCQGLKARSSSIYI